jgi:hypothetical protein
MRWQSTWLASTGHYTRLHLCCCRLCLATPPVHRPDQPPGLRSQPQACTPATALWPRNIVVWLPVHVKCCVVVHACMLPRHGTTAGPVCIQRCMHWVQTRGRGDAVVFCVRSLLGEGAQQLGQKLSFQKPLCNWPSCTHFAHWGQCVSVVVSVASLMNQAASFSRSSISATEFPLQSPIQAAHYVA